MDRSISNLSDTFLDTSGSSFRLEVSSPTAFSSSQGTSSNYDADEVTLRVDRKEVVRLQFEASTARAQEFLETLTVQRAGFCYESILKPSKEGGYIQLSADGANKFATLGEMLGWAAGFVLRGGLQISHRCNRPTCIIPAHVCPECAECNNGRKNCLVVVDCPHDGCELKILVCPHSPSCITYVEGYETWEEFLKWGVH
jgi:hypothetical protein